MRAIATVAVATRFLRLMPFLWQDAPVRVTRVLLYDWSTTAWLPIFVICFEVCYGLRSTSTHLLIYREWRCNASRWNDSRSNAWSRIALKRPALNGDPTGLVFGGTGLCSYRVRGVDGTCAERLTVESYTVFICQQSYLLLILKTAVYP